MLGKCERDYILALKANHPTLHGQVKAWFEQAQAQEFEDISFTYDERVVTLIQRNP